MIYKETDPLKWECLGTTSLPHSLKLFCRSEDMTLYQIAIPKDDSWDVMNQLGNLNLAHFIDLNKDEQPFNLPYANQIKRCEETERRLM